MLPLTNIIKVCLMFVKQFLNRNVSLSNGYPLPPNPAITGLIRFNCCGEWFRVVTCSSNTQLFSTTCIYCIYVYTYIQRNIYINNIYIIYIYIKERKRKADPNLPVGCSFFLIPRSRQRSDRCTNNVNFENHGIHI